MIAAHVHDALGQVRRLRRLIIEKRSFRGYSGVARVASGTLALAAAAAMVRAGDGWGPPFQLAVWAAVAAAALLLNYGALAIWFLFDPEVGRQPRRLLPAADALPALGIGAVLTVALARQGQYGLLPGTWMVCYGAAHVAHRQSLPLGNYLVGLFYLAAGAVCLLAPGGRLAGPSPMGLVFFVGEWSGGLVLIRMGRRLTAEAGDAAPNPPKGTVE